MAAQTLSILPTRSADATGPGVCAYMATAMPVDATCALPDQGGRDAG